MYYYGKLLINFDQLFTSAGRQFYFYSTLGV